MVSLTVHAVINDHLHGPVEPKEYAAADYVTACTRLGARQSMGRVGCALDNVAAEAFSFTIKVEDIHRQRFGTRTGARIKIATWIVDFYNLRRRHSACGGMSLSTMNSSQPSLEEPKPLNGVFHDTGDRHM